MRSIRLSRQEVLDYIEEHKLGIFISYTEVYDKDGNLVEGTFDDEETFIEPEAGEDDTLYEYWGVSTETGFSIFDSPIKEDKAKYAGVLFHLLVNEYWMGFGDAELLAGSYVTSYKVMQKPLTEEEEQEFRQKAITALKEGNVIFAGPHGEENCENS